MLRRLAVPRSEEDMNRRLAAVIIGAVACMGLVPGMSASAAVPDADGTIHACYGKVGGIVRIIEPARGERCLTKAESDLTFSQRGPTGPAGPPGMTGMDGPAGAPGGAPTVASLASGDRHCPAGGAAITDSAGSTAYVCSGAAGAPGQDGAPFSGTFTSPNGAYSISVTDQGVAVSHGTSGLVLAGDTLKVTGGTLTIQVSGNAAVEAGGATSVRTGADLTVQSGGSTVLKPAAHLTLDAGGATTVTSGGVLGVTAPLITLNSSSCRPAARIADSVAVSGSTGTISGGSTTVCIG
jgi:hypothetical protein